MKKLAFTLTALSLAASSSVFAAAPNIDGDSSSGSVVIGTSTIVGSGGSAGYAGLSFNGSGFADILQSPIYQATNGWTDANGDRWANLPTAPNPIIAQVWAYTANSTVNVYSLRQVMTPSSPMPTFGGLVIGQVKDASGNAYGLGQGVYFGEWSPQNPPLVTTASNNLNMDDGDRAVWYVGDNAVTAANMPSAISATYNVVGISQTGTDASSNTLPGGLPANPNLYTGQLDVSYASGSGTIGAGVSNNSISRVVGGVTHTISFAGTTISSNGTFGNGSTIEGRFYNGAEALAGMYTNGTLPDAAFGGSKVSGTITP